MSVKNKCARAIKVKLCYFQTDRCKEFNIHAYERVDSILGTMTKVTSFRYSLVQK
ncbi:coproporphyrinogen III oxidase [Bradyrhizobium sp. USDA 223]